jgi:hypothetical protein
MYRMTPPSDSAAIDESCLSVLILPFLLNEETDKSENSSARTLLVW